MNAIATYLIPEFYNDSISLSGEVHSVFSSALNVMFDDIMLTFTTDAKAGIPDSVVLPPDDFGCLQELKYEDVVEFSEHRIVFPGKNINIRLSCPNHANTFPKNCRTAGKEEIKRRLSQLKKAFPKAHRLPPQAENSLPKLIQAVMNHNFDDCKNILPSIIGLGNGLTPATDDALLGVMAVMTFIAVLGEDPMPEFPELVYQFSWEKTTDVSRKYLRCAVQERFSLPLIHCICSLLNVGTIFNSSDINQLLNTGHTSGKDTLKGVLSFMFYGLLF